MGRRKKRRKRRRARERAEKKQEEQRQAQMAAEDSGGQDESGRRFGFTLPGSQPNDEPQYDDEPWWADEDGYELTDYEVKQYGQYRDMPPPMKPEHLREPESQQDGKTVETLISVPRRALAAAGSGLGRVFGRFKRVDWELVWLRIHDAGAKVAGGGKYIVDEVRFRNLQMQEKLSRPVRFVIYGVIGLVVLGIPALIAASLLVGSGADTPQDTPIVLTSPPETAPTRVPQVVKPTARTSQPTATPTTPPLPTSTFPPPTPVPTNPPASAATGDIAPFFAPPVQQWSADIVRWSQQYGLDANLLAMVMQLETCGNPLYVGSNGFGLFAVPEERFSADEAFNNPEHNVRRGAEALQECLAQAEGDIGQAYVCYHSGAETLQSDFGQWSQETQRYFLWGLGIIGDAQNAAVESAALNDWLVNGGGFDTCNQAQAMLGG